MAEVSEEFILRGNYLNEFGGAERDVLGQLLGPLTKVVNPTADKAKD